MPDNVDPEAPVCPARTNPELPLSALDGPRREILTEAGLTGLVAHSLRHSFARLGAEVDNGRYAPFVSSLLGHGVKMKRTITERYAGEMSAAALRPAANAIAGRIGFLLGIGELADVIDLAARR